VILTNQNQANQKLFSKAAASRILNIKPCFLKMIAVEKDGVIVEVKGEKQIIPPRRFLEDFASFRKDGAKNLTSVPVYSHVYSVFNPKKGTSYLVQTRTKGLVCQCEDWKGCKIMLGHGICKHSYRVLFDLGFLSLAEYLEAQRSEVELPQAPELPDKFDFEKIKLPKLKELARDWNIVPVGDKRYRKTWITALQEHARKTVSLEGSPVPYGGETPRPHLLTNSLNTDFVVDLI
jgi:hypothetical protein